MSKPLLDARPAPSYLAISLDRHKAHRQLSPAPAPSHSEVQLLQTRFLTGWLDFFSALVHRDFRLFWVGLMAQVTGQQMTIVTLGWLAYYLTESPLALGIINLLSAAPRLIINLLGGVLADRVDPRALIAGAQAISALVLIALGVLAITNNATIWHLAVAAFILGLVQSFDEPSRASLFPRLLPDRSFIPSAVPLISLAWSSTRIIAPSIAGFAIAAAGAGVSFFIASAGAATMVAMIRLIRVREVPARSQAAMLDDLKAGARYVWAHPVFRPLLLVAFINSAFGQGYMLTLPVFQADVLHIDARGLGLMYSVLGVGAVSGLFIYSRFLKRLPPGRVVLGAVILFSIGLISFAASPWFGLSLVLLFSVGVVAVIQITTGQVILQTLVEDHLRGRVMSLYGLHWVFLPVSGAIMNSVAQLTGAPLSLAGSATIVLVSVSLIALRSAPLRGVTLARANDPETPAAPQTATASP